MTLNRLIFIKISTFNQLISDSAILGSLKLTYNEKIFTWDIFNKCQLFKAYIHTSSFILPIDEYQITTSPHTYRVY